MIMIQRRRRRNVPHSFENQLEAGIEKLEAQAASLVPGPAREEVRVRIRELQTAVKMNEWLKFRGRS